MSGDWNDLKVTEDPNMSIDQINPDVVEDPNTPGDQNNLHGCGSKENKMVDANFGFTEQHFIPRSVSAMLLEDTIPGSSEISNTKQNIDNLVLH